MNSIEAVSRDWKFPSKPADVRKKEIAESERAPVQSESAWNIEL